MTHNAASNFNNPIELPPLETTDVELFRKIEPYLTFLNMHQLEHKPPIFSIK
jgi:hypothetical protein